MQPAVQGQSQPIASNRTRRHTSVCQVTTVLMLSEHQIALNT